MVLARDVARVEWGLNCFDGRPISSVRKFEALTYHSILLASSSESESEVLAASKSGQTDGRRV